MDPKEEEEIDELTLPASGSLFKGEDREEVLKILGEIKEGGEEAHAAGTLRYARVREILEDYQEQGVLLRSVLPEFAGLIVDAFWKRALKDESQVLQRFGSAPIADMLANNEEYEEDDAPRTHLHEIATIAYTLAKVVNPKNLLSHLPHDVREFEYAFYYLIFSIKNHASRTWEIRYFLMLWMTNTILVPFDLASIDSGMHDTLSLPRLVIEVAKHCLRQPGNVRDISSLLVSRLLTRPDMARSEHLSEFLKWCQTVLSVEDEEDMNSFGMVGALSAIASILKFGKRSELWPYLDFISEIVTQEKLMAGNMLIIKTLVKAVQRLGLAYLKPKVVTWRYQRGMRSLIHNLHGTTQQPTTPDSTETEPTIDFAPMELEPVLGVLLDALKHQDTIVRWSAAKGIGRVVARLEKPEGDDVLNAVLDLFDLYEDSNGWHGGCLALAELSRRGLLLPQRFDRVIPITLKALHYEVLKGSYVVGRHVRDAGCYVCWAFARAYSPADIASYAARVSSTLLSTACFDKEISVRRAAAAAFQECIGRLGNFPHGIDIVTKADYFSLSIRRRAYLEISTVIAGYDVEYHQHFAEHLVENRLVHPDREIRQLAAKALGCLAASEEVDGVIVSKHLGVLLERCIKTGSVDARHGAVLGVAEVVATSAAKLSDAIIADIVTLMPRIESARLYRGRGGEYIRIAVCRLIESFSHTGIPLPATIEVKTVKGVTKTTTLGRYQQCLDEQLGQIVEDVQIAAAAAFAAFSQRYFETYDEKFHGKVTKRLVALLNVQNLPNERRGGALALGLMPHFEETHETVVNALSTAIPVEENPEERDAETRRNACTSLSNVVVRMQNKENAISAFGTLEKATTDYTIDQRGDVGSMVRIAGMEALVVVALQMCEWGLLDEMLAGRLFCALLRQSAEKLDKVRNAAGTLLQKAATDALLALLPSSDSAFLRTLCTSGITDWGAPQETFSRIAPLLSSPLLRLAVLDGIVVAAGGMSVHVSRPAFDALTLFLSENESSRPILTNGIADVLRRNSRDERVVLPLLGTCDKLIALSLVPAEAAGELAAALREEVKKSVKEIHTLLPAVDVLCGLLALVEGEGQGLLLHCLLSLLAGRFPKVRRKCATSLYAALLLSPLLGGEGNPEAQQLLLEEPWDAPSAERVRSARDKLYPLLSLTKPIFKPAAQQTTTAKPLADANAHYSALVRDAGY